MFYFNRAFTQQIITICWHSDLFMVFLVFSLDIRLIFGIFLIIKSQIRRIKCQISPFVSNLFIKFKGYALVTPNVPRSDFNIIDYVQ